MELVKPAMQYKNSFIAAVKELQKEGHYDTYDSERYKRADIVALENDFDTFVRDELEKADGKHLPPGYVPETNYWLVDRGEYLGRVSIRHQLTDHLLRFGGHIGYDIRPSERKRGYGTLLLKLALPKAKELGIDRALITCDETNIGSRKIIEAAGGVLENSVPGEKEGSPNKLRFWIDL